MIMIGGYSHPKHQVLGNWGPSPECLAKLPYDLRELLNRRPYWTWPERHRKLGITAHQKNVSYKARMWSVPESS